MEIPTKLKKLYRHWNFHTTSEADLLLPNQIFKDRELFENISWFVNERVDIWKKKVIGELPPYTKDPILSQYRFCNIFREFDKQTIEFHTLLNPLRDDFPLWLLNMFYCRMVANPQTVKTVGFLSFDTEKNKEFYKKFIASPRPRFGVPPMSFR
ncbi:MAG: putative DNA base hypermodification protein [Candidatus Parcubacteria bacterium]|nr:putative DNA base hypermodification protein [Candidatus Parcubacteria bacterium]